jgi:hydroxybutyrate-dimer hydrolase
MLVQIPDSFDPENACLVTGPSSGSRGIYGAIGTSGEWGLANNCAVVYTDKGTGTGAHDLSADTVYLIDGRLADATEAGKRSTFTAKARNGKLDAYVDANPNRWAFKHAHSERNPEADWDKHVLRSLTFARWAINEHLSVELGWDDILVIGTSVSNGGGATLRAAEMARPGLFDGIAVSEPNVNPVFDDSFVIQQGTGTPLAAHSRTLFDYTSLLNLYQGCANQAPSNASAPLNASNDELTNANRCTSLAELGLLTSGSLSARAEEAQTILNNYGLVPEQNAVQPFQWFAQVPQGISVTYANAYARASVIEDLCGYSFAAADGTGQPVALAEASKATLFGTSNGIPPTGGIQLINQNSVDGPLLNNISVSPSTGRMDENVDGAVCLRNLQEGNGPRANRLAGGVKQILADGRLKGTPTIIVQGRADGVLPVNHTGRPYYALSRLRDGNRSQIAYIEVLNAHHLDAFNQFPGFNERYVPLHYYFLQALDMMLSHLTTGATLPQSQVVRTVPRGPGAPPLTAANVPPIALVPAPGNAILFDGTVLSIPD